MFFFLFVMELNVEFSPCISTWILHVMCALPFSPLHVRNFAVINFDTLDEILNSQCYPYYLWS